MSEFFLLVIVLQKAFAETALRSSQLSLMLSSMARSWTYQGLSHIAGQRLLDVKGIVCVYTEVSYVSLCLTHACIIGARHCLTQGFPLGKTPRAVIKLIQFLGHQTW